MKFVIIGGGVAALEAAITIRQRQSEAQITLLSREAVLPYRRPALSRMVAAPIPDEQFLIKPAAFYEQQHIDVELDTTVRSIDRANRRVITDHTSTPYDALILATGSRCFLPPIPGIDGASVVTLREFADLQEIDRRLNGGAIQDAVVIGCGPLGLELAESLLARNCRVTMVESCPRLMPRNFTPEQSAATLEELGRVPHLSFRFGATVESIAPDKITVSGEEIPADLVLVSAGNRANSELALNAGLACGRGVAVDAAMRTADPAIFAAGDCAEVNGTLYGLYLPSKAMGGVAGANAAGDQRVFEPKTYPVRLTAFGLKPR